MKKPAEIIPEIVTKAEKITGYKGTFSLRIDVVPFATWELKQGDKVVKSGTETPVLVEGVDVAEYTLVLSHPEHGTIQVPLKSLAATKTYQVKGLMSDKKSILIVPK